TGVIFKSVRSRCGQILDIETGSRVIESSIRYEYGRVAGNNVSTKNIPHSGRDNANASDVSRNNVVFNKIVRGGPQETDSKIGTRHPNVTITAGLIAQHPVAMAIAKNSYPAAGKLRGAIPDRYIGLDVVVGRVTDENARITVCRGCNVHYKTSAAITKVDAGRSKPLHQTRSLNGQVTLTNGKYAIFVSSPCDIPSLRPLAAGRGITLSGNCESVQIERKAGCAELYARCCIDCTGHITGEPCVLSDRPRCRDRAADGFLENGLWRGR